MLRVRGKRNKSIEARGIERNGQRKTSIDQNKELESATQLGIFLSIQRETHADDKFLIEAVNLLALKGNF